MSELVFKVGNIEKIYVDTFILISTVENDLKAYDLLVYLPRNDPFS